MSRVACASVLLSLIFLPAFGYAAWAQQSSVAAEWVDHKDPLGFEVRVPKGWGVTSTQEGRILVHSADKSVFAIVQPFLLKQATRADDWVGSSLEQMKTLFPEAQIQQKKQVNTRPDDVVATASYSSAGKPGQVNLLCSIFGPSGMLYAIAAPRDVFAAKKPTLLKVLRSLHFVQPTAKVGSGPKTGKAGGYDADITYIKWTDPKESAFTVDVPTGWKTEGGLFHPSTTDTRPQIVTVSADGLTQLQVGDSRIPRFGVPTPITESFARQGYKGFSEGDPIHLGSGLTMVRLHYLTGAEFSRRIAQNTCAKQHPNIQIAETRELAHEENPQLGTTTSSGVTNFTYQEDGRAMCGFTLVTTEKLAMSGVVIWQCKELLIGTGPDKPDQRMKMLAIVEHIMTSLAYDPAWYSANWRKGVMETNAYAALGQQNIEAMNRQANQQMADSRAAYRQLQEDRRVSLRQNFEEHMAAKDEMTRHWTNFAWARPTYAIRRPARPTKSRRDITTTGPARRT